MIKVNRRTDYAIRIMISLAMKGEAMKATELSGETDVPMPFLHKIIQELVRANLVRTTAGVGGGADLAHSPIDITLLDIVEGIEGSMHLNICLFGQDVCSRVAYCSVHPIWERLQALIRRELSETNLETLAQEQQKLIYSLNGGLI